MSDEEDYSSEDDFDYVPSAGEEVSEEEGSGDEEDVAALAEDAKKDGKVGGRKERRKKANDLAPRKRKGGIKLEGEGAENGKKEDENEEEKFDLAKNIAVEKEAKKEELEKKKADDLWSSFLADVKPKSQPVKRSQPTINVESAKNPEKTEASSSKSNITPSSSTSSNGNLKPEAKPSGKLTITKVFDFAGEEVKITKEVDASSKEAEEARKKQEKEEVKTEIPQTSDQPNSVLNKIGVKRPAASGGGGGLGGLLNKLGKKPKISVLDKSKMDWDSFKKDEGIEDDLKIHNRGKESYLERMAFLNRADVRQFEIEKSLRLGSSKR